MIENCVFKHTIKDKLVPSIPLIKVELFSIHTVMSFVNCMFQNIICWQSTIDINFFNLKLIPFILIPSIYINKRNAAKVIQSCTFSDNKNPLFSVRGHDKRNNNDQLHLGPIKVKEVTCTEDYTMYVRFIILFVKGPVTIENNLTPKGLLTFDVCKM